MKFILYIVSGFTLMYGSYFFYTLYSKSHQSNTNIFEDNISLKTDKKQNIEFDNFSDTQNSQKNEEKINPNDQSNLNIFKFENSKNLIGQQLKLRGTMVIKTSFIDFLQWFYNKIQKISSFSQAFLEIF